MENLSSPLAFALLYIVMPVWMLAGFADFACHRAMRIEHNAGLRESLLHLLMLAEIGIAILAALLLDVTAAVFALMLVACLAHEVTTCVDLAYAESRRRIPWLEQWIHGLQQSLPWAWLTGWMILSPAQARAFFGLGDFAPDWGLGLKSSPLPIAYLVLVMTGALLLLWGPFLYESWRCRQVTRAPQVL